MTGRSPANLWMALALLLALAAALAGCEPEVPAAESGPTTPEVRTVARGLIAPIGMAALPDGRLLVAESGSGERDDSGRVSLVLPDGRHAPLVAGLPSTRDAGDLAGVPLVAHDAGGDRVLIGAFGVGALLALPLDALPAPGELPTAPRTMSSLDRTMQPLNNVRLTNPFDLAFDPEGRPVVTDASGNGVATVTTGGGTAFFHRFEPLPNPVRASDPVEAVPTGLARIGDEYFVTLTGGCPYPDGAGRLVAIDASRNERVIAEGLQMPIDVTQDAEGTLWLLEFATFQEDASCFTGEGYEPGTGRLSRISASGKRETVVDGLDYPGALVALPDGTLVVSEVFGGRLLRIWPEGGAPAVAEPPPLPEERPGPHFVDVTGASGLDFIHGAFQFGLSADPIAMMGGGLCWLDADRDGWMDLYLVNSHALEEAPALEAADDLPANALFFNRKGRFERAGPESGVAAQIRGNGCLAADFDGDGWTDLYVTADGPNLLFWNEGNGRFVEGGETAGVAAPEWNSAAAAGDLNGDGLLDLYVGAYIDLERMIDKPSGAFPQDFLGLPDRLYLNQGADGGRVRFEEVTLSAGLEREERALGALLSDLDDDGDLDLYIANDGQPNRLYENVPERSDLGFALRDLSDHAGVGDSGSGMGVAGGDVNGDGLGDLFVTNWDVELNALYRSRGSDGPPLTFEYATYRIGISGMGRGLTGWGTTLGDMDNDSDVDILVVNGRVPIQDLEQDREPIRLYLNREIGAAGTPGRPGQFLDGSAQMGLAEIGPLLGRGGAVADYDNDGDLDLAIATIGGAARLLENRGSTGHWLTVDGPALVPGTRAVVTLPDGRILRRELHAGSSYLASEDPRLHFGLGSATTVQLEIFWPDGRRSLFRELAADQFITPGRDRSR